MEKTFAGTFSSSPVDWRDHLFATNENGVTFVLQVTAQNCEIVAENTLGEETFATPVICDSRIYLRHASYEDDLRQENLYCLSNRDE